MHQKKEKPFLTVRLSVYLFAFILVLLVHVKISTEYLEPKQQKPD